MDNVTFMHKLLNFVYNKNIDEVETIFKDQVTDDMLKHLIEKKDEYQHDINDNTKAWLAFIGNLDTKNSEILTEYILNR